MSSPQPVWKILNQAQATEQDTAGNFVPGWRVYFQTLTGVTGSVFVPQTLYSAANVRDAVAAQVDTINEVSGLTG